MPTLNFKSKSFIQNHHLAVPHHVLVPDKKKSLTKKVSLHDNLILHGDNLKALKSLLPTYAGKVKCIYIDPPYNTGNEHWAYNDNVNSPMMQEWLGKIVDRDDLTRHDKWLAMMMPRLKLLRELLREDGVILVSMSDEELAHLLLVCSEVFGEQNHIANFIWHNEGNIDNQSKIKINHEYIVAFAKDIVKLQEPAVIDPNIERQSKLFKEEIVNSITKNGPKNPPGRILLPAGFPCDFEKGNILETSTKFPKILSNGIVKNFELTEPITVESGWSSKNLLVKFIQNKFENILDQHDKPTWFKLTKSGAIYVYKARSQDQHHVLSVLRNFGTTKQTSSTLASIGLNFEYPKPVKLIDYLIRVFTPNRKGIVLDSFAGSGTTAHATLQANASDKGSRQFILIEMEDYADKITAERVRRVIKGVPKAKDEQLKKGLGGTFSYFELGEPIELESILSGDRLPPYEELARYVFYTATGEEFVEKAVDQKRGFIGSSKDFDVYLLYKPDVDYLKKTALTLEWAQGLGKRKSSGKRRLVFAPTKYLSQEHLDEFGIDFAQLPFEIYRLAK